MTQLEDVQRQAEQLCTDDVGKLRRWLVRFEAALWHRELESDLQAACFETDRALAIHDGARID